MKKQLITITIIWLLALMISILVLSRSSREADGTYKVTINRIHQRFTDDVMQNKGVINNLTNEELKVISRIEMIDYQNKTIDEMDQFFLVKNNEKVVYRPIEETNLIVKYHINYDNKEYTNILWSMFIISTLYVVSLISVLLIHKNIIKPLWKITDISKQLARGYLGEVNYQVNNRYFKEFVWGLDMLREQLLYEKDKNAELEKQQKTLVAGLSHDLKTPLSSVKNYTIALKEGIYDSDDDRKKALDVILDKVGIIENISKELLNASLKEIRSIKVNPIETYMLEIHNRLNRIIQEKKDLFHMDYIGAKLKDNLLVLVDIDRLQEVFDNIIDNAIKYGDLKSLEISYHAEEYYQLIEIHNTGKPIPKPEMKYIFNSYYRGSNVSEKPGHGLGLYISKQIMKNMQGDLFAKNSDDGVSFVVVIKQVG